MESVIYFNLTKPLKIQNVDNLVFEEAPRLYSENGIFVKKVDKELKLAQRSIIKNGIETEELYREISKALKLKIIPLSDRGEIVKYEIDGFVAPHTDIQKTLATNCIEKTLVYYIKSPIKGGETVIDKTYKCIPGDILIFDKNLTHSCNKIIEGTKIVFIGDVFIEFDYNIDKFLESDELFLPVSPSILNTTLDSRLSLLSGILIDFDYIHFGDSYECCTCPGFSSDEEQSDEEQSDDIPLKHDWISKSENNSLIREKHIPTCKTLEHKFVIPVLFLNNKYIIECTNYKVESKILYLNSYTDMLADMHISYLSDETNTKYKIINDESNVDNVLTLEDVLSYGAQFKVDRKDLHINYDYIKLCTNFIKQYFMRVCQKTYNENFVCDWGRDSNLDVDCYTFKFYILLKTNKLYKEKAAIKIQRYYREYRNNKPI